MSVSGRSETNCAHGTSTHRAPDCFFARFISGGVAAKTARSDLALHRVSKPAPWLGGNSLRPSTTSPTLSRSEQSIASRRCQPKPVVQHDRRLGKTSRLALQNQETLQTPQRTSAWFCRARRHDDEIIQDHGGGRPCAPGGTPSSRCL
jgi:hypothetical protein